jgi:ATP-binding cassette subfamily C protein
LPLAVCSAIVEAASAAAVFGLLRIVTDPRQAGRLPLASAIYPLLQPSGDRAVILTFTLLVMLLYLVRTVVLAIGSYVEARVVYGAILDMSSRLLQTYLEAPYAFILQRNSAALIQRVRDGTDATANLILAPIVHLTTETLVIVAFLIVLGYAAPFVTLCAALALALFLLLPASATTRVFHRWGEDEERLEKALLQELQQSLGAVKEVRMAAAEPFFLERFRAVRSSWSHLEERRAMMTDGLRLAVETTFVATILLVVLVMTMRGDQGQRAVSLLGLYAYAGFRLVPSANRITRNLNCIRGGRPFVRDLETDVLLLARDSSRQQHARPSDALSFARTITFDNVSYVYANSRLRAVDNINLEIRRGESIGILGPTGSGKSTLVALLLGLLEPTSGCVLVDGRDIREASREWRRHIGYVPQEFYLLDESVRSNIAFGVADDQIDAERLRRAVRLAQLDEVIASLPDGLETPLGERGARLSGGQRQRIAIARALYHDPQVLVFDEATAALDLQTESEITRAVGALRGAKTVVVIAHRMSTVRTCDRLILLGEGRVADIGSFEDLLSRNAVFDVTAIAESSATHR